MFRLASIFGLLGLVTAILVACNVSLPTSSSSGTTPLATELRMYGWEGYMPQSVLDAFTAEYGIAINYMIYGDVIEATAALRSGESFDVVVLDNVEVQAMASEGLLAELDHRNLPNFSHVANEFRDLAFDPKNKYSIPFEWGTSGLLYRADQEAPLPGTWAGLWEPERGEKIGLWPYPRDVIGLTLKALGYSYNSEDLTEIAAAGEHLMKLQDRVVLLDPYQASGVPELLNGEVDVVFGWAYDIQAAEDAGPQKVNYVIPSDGTIVWMDNLTIPAASANKAAAELFLNFIMRPAIAAQISNETYLAMPNEGAYPFIEPEIRHNRLIFPTNDDLANAEFVAPLSLEAQAAHDEIWARFVAELE